MDGTEALPTQGELAIWKMRAIDVATQLQHPDVADVLRRGGGTEQLIRVMGEFPLSEIEKGWVTFLAPLAADPTLGHILALLTLLGKPDATVTLPPIIDGPETTTMSAQADELREQIRAAGDASGRRKGVRLIEYLSSACASVRLSAIGVGASGFSGSGNLIKVLIDSLVLTAAFEVVKSSLSKPADLDEAFALALSGFAPIEHREQGWVVRRVF